ncbi:MULTISPECIES: IS607 family transposase [Calidithermus]|uniref:IS607 family transposase n=1 Tax=Calidithermus TaxID=2747271 RepID=UPI00048228D8|nr:MULTISPECIES: IS607 family transposase [Calidithermus]
MKLSEWARANGISYKTAWLWWKHGKLPVPARQTPTGTILVDVPERKEAGAVLYARVSSADQKADLDRQVARLAAFAAERGIKVAKVVAEVGSGLNGHRKGLISVLRSPEYGSIIVEHRDRLARFGSEYIEAALAACGRRVLVVEPDEVKDDLAQDMIDVLTSFCARLYGRRSARQRAARGVKAAMEP